MEWIVKIAFILYACDKIRFKSSFGLIKLKLIKNQITDNQYNKN